MDAFASVVTDNDFQATSVPCQSFIGFVISKMANSGFADRQTLLKHALVEFCPRYIQYFHCAKNTIVRAKNSVEIVLFYKVNVKMNPLSQCPRLL